MPVEKGRNLAVALDILHAQPGLAAQSKDHGIEHSASLFGVFGSFIVGCLGFDPKRPRQD
jgi:hypothetical protein